MPSIFGRSVTVPLTNKSGGSLAKGDVVVIDTSNDAAVTTTTSAATTNTVGVVVEENGIASNATGKVTIAGYVALVNVNASVTRGNYGGTHTVAKQAASLGSSRAAGAFCKFLTGGTTPSAHLFGMTDATTGAGAGSYTGVTWSSGTSMPGSPATNDRVTRTDLGMDFYYDGTRWVSVTLFTNDITIWTQPTAGLSATTAATTRNIVPAAMGGSDIWMVDHKLTFIVVAGTALGASHKWVGTLDKVDTSNAATTIVTDTIASGSSSVWRTQTDSINALLGTTWFVLQASWTKTGTPGNLIYFEQLTYRVVAT